MVVMVMVVMPMVRPASMTRTAAPPREAVEARAVRMSRRFTAEIGSVQFEVRLTDKARRRQPLG